MSTSAPHIRKKFNASRQSSRHRSRIALACGLPAKADVMKELAPTGKLRVAIAVAPAPSALYTIKDEATGQYRGVTVELGTAMAKKLGVPVEFVPHLASGEIQNSADANRWDVTFMPVDEERKKFVDFGNAYHLLQSTYLVAPGAKMTKIDDAVAAMKAGEIDCIALSRESLSGLTAKIPGSRILEGGFLNSSTAVAVPKGKPEALAYVSQFIEQ